MIKDDNSLSLAALVAAPVDVPVGGVVLKIQPLGWYESVGAIDAVAPALATMPEPPAKGGEINVELWLAWVGQWRDQIVAFLVLATKCNAADISAIPPLALVELVFGVMEINADFFVKSLPTAVAGVAGRAGALMARIKALDVQALAASPESSST